MTIQSSNINSLRPLHFFDGELGAFHSLLLEMTDLLMYQMEQCMYALDYGDMDLALKVVSRDRKVDANRARIEDEIQHALAQNVSLTSDLRIVMTILKIAGTLEKIGNEIVELAHRVKSLFDRHSNRCNTEMMAEIIYLGGMIKIMLDKMTAVLETRNSNQAYKLMKYSWNCDTRLQQALKYQLISTEQNAAIIEHTLDIMRILRALERCAGFCRNIAEYQILMLDCIDMRRHSSLTVKNVNLA